MILDEDEANCHLCDNDLSMDKRTTAPKSRWVKTPHISLSIYVFIRGLIRYAINKYTPKYIFFFFFFFFLSFNLLKWSSIVDFKNTKPTDLKSHE